MPHVAITIATGPTLEQKRRIVTRITDLLIEEAGALRDSVSVAIVEVGKEGFARGGVLVADRKR